MEDNLSCSFIFMSSITYQFEFVKYQAQKREHFFLQFFVFTKLSILTFIFRVFRFKKKKNRMFSLFVRRSWLLFFNALVSLHSLSNLILSLDSSGNPSLHHFPLFYHFYTWIFFFGTHHSSKNLARVIFEGKQSSNSVSIF